MPALPNPFNFADVVMPSAETAAASNALPDAAADRFKLDEAAFLEAIEPPPLFLQVPGPVMKILAWR